MSYEMETANYVTPFEMNETENIYYKLAHHEFSIKYSTTEIEELKNVIQTPDIECEISYHEYLISSHELELYRLKKSLKKAEIFEMEKPNISNISKLEFSHISETPTANIFHFSDNQDISDLEIDYEKYCPLAKNFDNDIKQFDEQINDSLLELNMLLTMKSLPSETKNFGNQTQANSEIPASANDSYQIEQSVNAQILYSENNLYPLSTSVSQNVSITSLTTAKKASELVEVFPSTSNFHIDQTRIDNSEMHPKLNKIPKSTTYFRTIKENKFRNKKVNNSQKHQLKSIATNFSRLRNINSKPIPLPYEKINVISKCTPECSKPIPLPYKTIDKNPTQKNIFNHPINSSETFQTPCKISDLEKNHIVIYSNQEIQVNMIPMKQISTKSLSFPLLDTDKNSDSKNIFQLCAKLQNFTAKLSIHLPPNNDLLLYTHFNLPFSYDTNTTSLSLYNNHTQLNMNTSQEIMTFFIIFTKVIHHNFNINLLKSQKGKIALHDLGKRRKIFFKKQHLKVKTFLKPSHSRSKGKRRKFKRSHHYKRIEKNVIIQRKFQVIQTRIKPHFYRYCIQTFSSPKTVLLKLIRFKWELRHEY